MGGGVGGPDPQDPPPLDPPLLLPGSGYDYMFNTLLCHSPYIDSNTPPVL